VRGHYHEALLKPNVLQLISSFHLGGSERQALQLARMLQESGRYSVHLAALDRAGSLIAQAEQYGFSPIPEFRFNKFYSLGALSQASRFGRFLKERDIAILHTHDFYTNVFGMFAAALAGVKVRIASRRETTVWRTPAQKRVERVAYRFSNRVVANSEAVRRQLVAEGIPPEKTITIYNGVDMARVALPEGFIREEALARFDLPREESLRFVTIVANMRHEVKDHRTFLKAARRVRAVRPEARFVIAGEGELASSLKAMAKELGLERDLLFAGRRDEVAELLAVSSICVLSSKAEGFSNSILEYMAAARPVVVTDVGGAREAVTDGETGYIVAPGDDEAMANRIIALLGAPSQAKLFGERGRETVLRRFSIQSQRARVETLYDNLLSRKRAREEIGREILEGSAK
jgi:glycosyltransferase involved in cell wall biosynthesis